MKKRERYKVNNGFNYNVYKERGEYLVEYYFNDYLFCTSYYNTNMDLDQNAADIVYQYLECDSDSITTKVLFKRMSEKYF